MQVLNEEKTGRNHGASDVSLKLIAASREVVMHVMAEIWKKILDGFGMPVECAIAIMVPIFNGKGDIR